MDRTFVGAARRLDDVDLPRIGALIGVGEDELHAFMEVEAAGSGFDSLGRPKMLFEPHVFYRNLSGSKRSAAVAKGLAYARWGEKPYPKDSYPRLLAAMEIDETAALLAASWGLTQMLGENFRMAGFAYVYDMVKAFMADEENQLEACVKFLIAAGIDDDLRAHRWDVVARVYNGPGYAKNQYDVKMAKAFAKWAKIPDTPWDASASPIAAIIKPDFKKPLLRRGDDGPAVINLQKLLAAKGYSLGKFGADGDFGSATEGAVKTLQGRSHLSMDGVVGPKTWGALAA
ncbi:hypothetical protein MAUB1S_11478 [Mycolicibacterium aubagnense]